MRRVRSVMNISIVNINYTPDASDELARIEFYVNGILDTSIEDALFSDVRSLVTTANTILSGKWDRDISEKDKSTLNSLKQGIEVFQGYPKMNHSFNVSERRYRTTVLTKIINRLDRVINASAEELKLILKSYELDDQGRKYKNLALYLNSEQDIGNGVLISQNHNGRRVLDQFEDLSILDYKKRLDVQTTLLSEELAQHPNYTPEFRQSTDELINLIIKLREDHLLSDESANEVTDLTHQLVKNPANYVIFLTEAKKHEALAGGKLSAYMMLVAGYAAKIVTMGCKGEVWIKSASAKIDLINAVEKIAVEASVKASHEEESQPRPGRH